MVSRTDEREIRRLLDALAFGRWQAPGEWLAWQITPIVGGVNNLVYHATSAHADLAIKFTIRDARDRAGREYAALSALEQAHLNLAPKPLLLDRFSYPQPVVVQTWIAGRVRQTPPETESEWQALLQHHLAIQALTPQLANLTLPAAFMDADSAASAWRLVHEQVERIPEPNRPTSLRDLLHHEAESQVPTWTRASITLCRVDANITNFIWWPGSCFSVDWENSGWGDPAFEIANLMAHPAYLSVPAVRWEWLVDTYGQSTGSVATVRIWTYYKILLVWWVASLARRLYEIPRGLDQRLVGPSASWEADMRARYEHYAALANTAFGSAVLVGPLRQRESHSPRSPNSV